MMSDKNCYTTTEDMNTDTKVKSQTPTHHKRQSRLESDPQSNKVTLTQDTYLFFDDYNTQTSGWVCKPNRKTCIYYCSSTYDSNGTNFVVFTKPSFLWFCLMRSICMLVYEDT